MNLQKTSEAVFHKFSIIIPITMVFFLLVNFQVLAGSAKIGIETTKEEPGSTERGTISIEPWMMKPVLVVDGRILPEDFDIKIINKDNILSFVILTPDNGNTTEELIAKYGPNAQYGVILVTSKKNDSQPTSKIQQNTDSICTKAYSVIEMLPLFPGGEQKLNEFINNNLKYPEGAKKNNIQGMVVVRFVVSSIGTIEHSEVIKSLDPECDKEALRVVNSIPFFIPGRQNGINVCVKYTLPVTFKITPPYDPETMPVLILDGKELPKGFDTKSLNKDSIQSIFVIKPDTKKKKEELIDKYGDNAKNGVILITSKKSNPPTSAQTNQNIDSFGNKIYTVIEVMPQFPGGEQNLIKFIEENTHYPEDARTKGIYGTVIVRFVVNSFGIIEKGEITKSLDPECDKEALRIIHLLPTWIPGKQAGQNVSVWFTIPIRFKNNYH